MGISNSPTGGNTDFVSGKTVFLGIFPSKKNKENISLVIYIYLQL